MRHLATVQPERTKQGIEPNIMTNVLCSRRITRFATAPLWVLQGGVISAFNLMCSRTIIIFSESECIDVFVGC